MSDGPEERQLYEVRLGIYATPEQASRLTDRIQRLLCPEPEHQGPCEIPWASALHGPDDETDEMYAELVDQYRAESGQADEA